MIITLQVEHHAFATCHLIAHISLKDGRQRWYRHIATQIEACIGMLIVATGGAVETIMRVLLQAKDTIRGRDIRGVAYQTCRAIIILFSQDNLLTPVTCNIAHECRTSTCATMRCPTALLREFYQTVTQHLRYHHIGTPAATARRVDPLALQVTIPPGTFIHRA